MNTKFIKRILSLTAAASLLSACLPLHSVYAADGTPPARPPYYIDEVNGFIMDINRDTSVAAFKARYIDTDVQVYKGENEVTEGNIATGYKIHLSDAEGASREYTAVVHGDVDGDGLVNIADVMEVCKILARKSAEQIPEKDAYFCAAGVDAYLENGNVADDVGISDVMEICKALASGRSIRYAARIFLNRLTLDAAALELTVGATHTLTAAYDDPAAGDYLQWTSSQPEILSVNSGRLQALAAGNAVVTVAFGALSASCSVEISAPPEPAAVDEGVYTLQNLGTDSMLQVGDDQSVGLEKETSDDGQKFRLQATSDNRYIIRSILYPDYALEPVDEGGAPSSEIGADLALQPLSAEEAGTWIFIQREDGGYALSPSGNTRSAMTAEDAEVTLQKTSADHIGQTWLLEKQAEETPAPDEPDRPDNPIKERIAWIDYLQTSPSVRVRSGPSTSYDIVGGFLDHQQILVTGEAVDGWYPVKGQNMGNGAEITGYTSGDYISFTQPDVNPAPMPADIEKKLASLRVKFPDGRYWNHIGGENNPDGWTDTPCPADQNGGGSHTHNTYLPGECDCNNFNNAIQCMGFAFKIGNELFGTNVRNWKKFYDFDSVKVGDYIRYGGHSVIVIGKDDTGVTVVECNFDKQCGIRWDRFIPRNTLESQNAEYRTNS